MGGSQGLEAGSGSRWLWLIKLEGNCGVAGLGAGSGRVSGFGAWAFGFGRGF